jgi:hypothetical protein
MVSDTIDWQGQSTVGPHLTPIAFPYQLSSGATALFLGPSAGLSIALYGLVVQNQDQVGDLIVVQDTAGGAIFGYLSNDNGFISVPCYGLRIGMGLGMQVHNAGTSNMTKQDIVNIYYALA